MNIRRLAFCAILFGFPLLALLVAAAPIRRSIAAQIPFVSKSNTFSLPFGTVPDQRTEAHNSSLSVPSASSAVKHPNAWDWQIETVAVAEWSGDSDSSLALDGNGKPSISYSYTDLDKWASFVLKYAQKTDGAWDIQTVDHYFGLCTTSLAVDRNGFPHISYCTDVGNSLVYAWWSGTIWEKEYLDGDHLYGNHTSLALDSAGHPHISYSRWAMSEVKYAHRTGSVWDIQTVDASRLDNALALDTQDRPNIGYCADGILKYARWTGANWLLQMVDGADGACETAINVSSTSLALDGDDRAHIAYSGGIPASDLKYARWTGTAWEIETIAEGSNPSLALDAEGRPHIAYSANSGVNYASLLAGEWVTQRVADQSTNPSLALDAEGYPHISYRHFEVGLMYARLVPPPLILRKQATPSEGLRNKDTLTYTLTISAPGLNVRLRDPLPASVRYITDTLASTLFPPVVYSPTTHAVSWTGVLPTDTVQTVRFQVTPRITGTGALSLSLPIINTAWLTDEDYDRTISASVIVNGKHSYLPLLMRQR